MARRGKQPSANLQLRTAPHLRATRGTFGRLHDQCLRLINKGWTGIEIAEVLKLPPALEHAWHARGYYGSVSHNLKAIYQRYMGWYDGNLAHLWQHRPVEQGKRYVELGGGADAVVTKARTAFDQGDFRWAAEILSHVVFAEPDHARVLLADTFEQLGYGAENGVWRNIYLSGATELREGKFGTPTVSGSADVLSALTPEMLFDAVAIQVDGLRAWDEKLTIDVVATDTGQRCRVRLANGALTYSSAPQRDQADVTLTTTARALPALAAHGLAPDALAESGIDVTGDPSVLSRLANLLDPGDPDFSIVTP
ncbi:alkyl sulfatase dimerization domain-containing protein [Streptomyces sp. NPDC057689]|uniref:alkyl sulfatase dimerization domain-containing protein n=1 Tax=Streptomyces sp. NPDC057689 TaxID=3346213 RepID=UPI0036A8CD5C